MFVNTPFILKLEYDLAPTQEICMHLTTFFQVWEFHPISIYTEMPSYDVTIGISLFKNQISTTRLKCNIKNGFRWVIMYMLGS